MVRATDSRGVTQVALPDPSAASPGSVERPRVLVVGADDWAVAQAIRVLELGGIETLTCHDLGAPALPCNALVKGRTCPLDVGFDAVVCVRSWVGSQTSPGDTGVICSLRTGRPLILAGVGSEHPLAPWADCIVAPDGDLVSACMAYAHGSTR